MPPCKALSSVHIRLAQRRREYRKSKKCPSVATASVAAVCAGNPMGTTDIVTCMHPQYKCPYTPRWQKFSSCLHERDACVAALWHDLCSPFVVPCDLDNGHTCIFQKMDHHLAGCIQCGLVHRCDSNQWSTTTTQNYLDRCLWNRQVREGRCPSVCMPDGSIVCSITGICVRDVSFRHPDEFILTWYNKAPGVAETTTTTCGTAASAAARAPTTNRAAAMAVADDDLNMVSSSLRNILRVVCKDHGILYSRFVDLCEKRNAVLHELLEAELYNSKAGYCDAAVCLLSIATRLQNAMQDSVDPYEVIAEKPQHVIESIISSVQPFILRLLTALRMCDQGRFKRVCIQWMLVGMLYLCTEGLSIMDVVILPKVQLLTTLLPADNKISIHFKEFGINTKCVTDTCNLIHYSMKRHPEIFEMLRKNA